VIVELHGARAATSVMANIACPVKPVKYIFSIFGDLYE